MKKKIVLIVLVLLALFLLRDYLKIDLLLQYIESIRAQPLAPLIFILVYVIATTLAIPATPLSLLGGSIFGFWWGFALTVLASNLGCHLAYGIAKYLGKDVIQRYVKQGSFLDTATEKAKQNAFVFLVYARLVPIFPFAAVNYLSGVIDIKYRHYALATFFGMLPGSAVYIYLGHTASNVQGNPLGLIISIAVLVVFTLVITLVAKKKGKKNHEESDA